MPGLLGYLPRSARSLPAEEIRQKLNGIDPLDRQGTRFEDFSDGSCIILNTTVAPRIPEALSQTVGNDGRSTLFLEGEIFGISGKDADAVCPAENLCEFLLSEYRRIGDEFINSLNGEFNIVIFDSEAKRLSIWSDHIASQPMYWFESASCFCFGSEKKFIQAVVEQNWEIDPVGLLQPIVHVHNLGSRTFIKGISRMLPGETIHVTQDGKVRRRVSEYIDLSAKARGKSADFLEEWRAQLLSATSRRFTGQRRVSMSLSAGLDSRAISASIDRNFRPIWARTWGNPASQEVRFARRIADGLGFQLMHQDPTSVRHSDGIHAIVWRTEGEIPYKNGVSFFAHESMKVDADFLAGGWLGDASSGAHLRPFMFLPSGRRSFIDRIFRWYQAGSTQDLSRIFDERFVQQHMPEVEHEFHQSYERFEQCDNAIAHEYWDLMNRQTRMTISSMPIDSHRFRKVRPFFDRNYLQFVMSLPMSARLGQHLYKTLIYEIGPEIRDVPNSNTGQTLKEGAVPNLVDYLRANKEKAFKRVFRTKASRSRQTPIIPAEDVAESIRRDGGVRQIVESFLESDCCDPTIFHVAGIRDLLAEHYESGLDHSRPLAWIATYSLSMPWFLYRRTDGLPAEAQRQLQGLSPSS